VDSANHFEVVPVKATYGNDAVSVLIRRMPSGPVPADEAINMAVWMMIHVDPDLKRFHQLMAEIKTL